MSRKIGFRTSARERDEQLPSVQPPADEQVAIHPKAEAVLAIAAAIDELMNRHLRCIARNEPFSKHFGHHIMERLDKLYIKHYEPL